MDGRNPISIKILQLAVLPLLITWAKKYGFDYMKKNLMPLVVKKINPYVKNFSKTYDISFFVQNSVFKINYKKGVKQGDSRLFSFEYHKVTIFDRKGNQEKLAVWHYHLENPDIHYVFKWNWQYSKGYSFNKSNYIWVW